MRPFSSNLSHLLLCSGKFPRLGWFPCLLFFLGILPQFSSRPLILHNLYEYSYLWGYWGQFYYWMKFLFLPKCQCWRHLGFCDHCFLWKLCWWFFFVVRHVVKDPIHPICWNVLGKKPKRDDIFFDNMVVIDVSWEHDSFYKVVND